MIMKLNVKITIYKTVLNDFDLTNLEPKYNPGFE